MNKLYYCLLFISLLQLSISKVYASDLSSFSAYKQVDGALGEIEMAVTNESLPVTSRLVDEFHKQQPGLRINLKLLSPSEAESWWLKKYKTRAGVLFQTMPNSESRNYVTENGYRSVKLRIASDSVAIVVNKVNPIVNKGLKMTEIDGIFSETLHRGHPIIQQWGDLGLVSDWDKRRVKPVAQDTNRFISQYFRKSVLKSGDYRHDIPRLMSASLVMQYVTDHIGSIGYVARSQLKDGVKVVKAINSNRNTIISSTLSNHSTFEYPMSFWLYLSINHKPGSNLSAETLSLLRFVYSTEGQKVLSDSGYEIVSEDIVDNDLNLYGLRLK